MTNLLEKEQKMFRGEHPSGLEDSELAFVSLTFWNHPDNVGLSRDEHGTWSRPGVWERLLAFQQGWKACKDDYKIED